jgi:hypothetical protein
MISDFEPCIFVFCKSRIAANSDVRQMMNSFFPCSSVEYLKRHKRHNPFTMRHCVFTVPYTDTKIKDAAGSDHMNRSQKSKAYGEWMVRRFFGHLKILFMLKDSIFLMNRDDAALACRRAT